MYKLKEIEILGRWPTSVPCRRHLRHVVYIAHAHMTTGNYSNCYALVRISKQITNVEL